MNQKRFSEKLPIIVAIIMAVGMVIWITPFASPNAPQNILIGVLVTSAGTISNEPFVHVSEVLESHERFELASVLPVQPNSILAYFAVPRIFSEHSRISAAGIFASPGVNAREMHLHLNLGNVHINDEISVILTRAPSRVRLTHIMQCPDGYIFLQSYFGMGGNAHTGEYQLINQLITNQVDFNLQVNLHVAYAPALYTVVHMSKNHEILAYTSFEPDNISTEIKTFPQTAYIIVEKLRKSPEGEEFVTREIVCPQANEYLRVCTVNEQGVLENKKISLIPAR